MPRRRAPPRLYLDKARRRWLIKDGGTKIRTGCSEAERGQAEKHLAADLGQKHKPSFGPDPLIADILLVYWREHLEHKTSAENYRYGVRLLGDWWGEKRLSDITPLNCRAFGKGRTDAAARHDLEILRAAIRYWHKHHGPLPAIPHIVLPPKPEPRTRWMTREEAAQDYYRRLDVPALAAGRASPGLFCLVSILAPAAV